MDEILKECGDYLDLEDSNKKQNDFTCDNCEFTSESKRSIKKHMKSSHKLLQNKKTDTITSDFACDKCAHNAINKDALKLHVETHHKDEKMSKEDLKSKQLKNTKRKHENENDNLLSRKKSK